MSGTRAHRRAPRSRAAWSGWLVLGCLVAASARCSPSGEGGGAAADAAHDAETPPASPCGIAVPTRPPEPARPRLGASAVQLEPERWGVSLDGTHPSATTEGLNQAIQWAKANGHHRLVLPAGTYGIGTDDRADYTGGLVLPSEFALELHADAVLALKPTSTPYYCMVRIFGQHDVLITGGRLRGDRAAHRWPPGVSLSGGVVDVEGHGVCVEKQSARVELSQVVIEDMIGDGVLIVADASPAEDLSTTDVWIHHAELANNGRQGVSIVGGERVLIEDSFLHDTNGAAPQFGVDIEGPRRRDRDILIRRNRFFQNYGGDVINTGGKNVWVEDNDCDQGAPTRRQTDGPIGFWRNTSNVIRRNRIRMSRGTANGLYGIYYYDVGGAPAASQTHVIEDNQLFRAGFLVRGPSPYRVARNVVDGMYFWSEATACLELVDNQVSNLRPADPEISWPLSGRTYRFVDTRGAASGNLANGEPVEFPLRLDASYDF